MMNAIPRAFVAALQAGNSLAALDLAAGMLRANMPLGRQWQAIARFAAAEGEWSIAVAAMRKFLEDEPTAVDRHAALAGVLSMAGRSADVVSHIESQASRLPDSAELQHALGIALIEIGKREQGVDCLNAVLRYRPTSGATWIALTGSQRLASDDVRFAQLAKLYEDSDRLLPGDRADVCFAFGKVLADVGEYDRAFAAYAQGARLIAHERPYDHARDRASAMANIGRRLVDVATADQPAPAIAVTGKPRSGTTLIQQLLASHSAVGSGGEINIAGPAQRVAEFHPGQQLSVFRKRYLHLLNVRFEKERIPVDKSLNTSRYAKIFRAALPDVPMVWVRRDPLDTAWSSFRTPFAHGLGWSYDLESMAQFHALEDMLHAFWSREYGNKLLTIDYVDLVERPAETVARLLSHCGLPAEDQVYDLHLSPGTIQTASVDQARRPINRDGLGVAQPYRRYLAPYEQAYAKARSSLGLAST